jgi:hypothetical protein
VVPALFWLVLVALRFRSGVRDQGDIALLEGDVPEPNEGW